MRNRIARASSILLVGAYIFLVGTGLYAQWYTGNPLFESDFPFSFLVGGGFVLGVWSVIGAFILWYYPKNAIGWILILFPLSWALTQFTWGYYQLTLASNSGGQVATTAALVWQNWTDFPVEILLLCFLFLLFPTGKPYSPRRPWIPWLGVLAYIGYAATETLKPGLIFPGPVQQIPEIPINPIAVSEKYWSYLGPLNLFFTVAISSFLVYCIATLVVRFNKASGDERQQIKWFAYFSVLFAVLTVIVLILQIAAPTASYLGITVIPGLILIGGIGVAIAIAIFRYRLYAIDIIIRQSLIYGTLTGALLLIYFALVALLGNLIFGLSGQRSSAIYVVSTLVIAALFNPLRRGLQDLIDRRFYRQKYDINQALSLFSLQVRHEVDVVEISEALLGIVDQTLQPQHASLWLRDLEPVAGSDPLGTPPGASEVT